MAHTTRSQIPLSIFLIIYYLTWSCSLVKAPGCSPFSYQNLSPFLRLRNCWPRMQAKVGPGACYSKSSRIIWSPRTHPQCPPPQASLPSRPGRGLCRPRARRHSPTSPPSSGPSRPPMGNELTVTRPLIGLSLSDLVTFADKYWQRDSFPTSSSCHRENLLRPHCSRQML